MPGCPHCSEPIDSLEGFIPQAKHEARLRAKTDENKALGDEVSRLSEQTKGFDAIVSERDKFRGDYEALISSQERSSAMSTAGLSPEFKDYAEMFYQSAQASGDASTFGEWLDGKAKEHPLLRDKFGAAASASETPPAVRPPSIPSTSDGVVPAPGPGGKMTEVDVQKYFGSNAYRNLSSEAKREKISELRDQVSSSSVG